MAVLVLGVSLTANAQRKKTKPEEPKKKIENPERSRGMELNLSGEQKQKLAQIRRQAVKERIRLNADMQIARLELREMLEADQSNQTMLDRKIEQLSGLHSQLAKNRLQSTIASRSVLTKEQRMMARQKMGKRMAKMHGTQRMRVFRFRRGPGGPGDGPGMMMFQKRGKPMGMEPGEPMDEEFEPMENEDFEGFGILKGTESFEFEDFAELDAFEPFDFEGFDELVPMLDFRSVQPEDDGWQ
jgi:Spy/CpxP family protein refolding chaperone